MEAKSSSLSPAERRAESALINATNRQEGLQLSAEALMPIDTTITPDAVDVRSRVVMEVYSRIGSLNAGQKNKVRADMLKLALLGERLPGRWRKIMCFASAEAAHSLTSISWTAEAARQFKIDVVVPELSPADLEAIQEAEEYRRRKSGGDDEQVVPADPPAAGG